MEDILNAIDGRWVSLNATEQKRNNIVVDAVLETLLPCLKRNKLFEAMYNKTFFSGSVYDDLKIDSSNEFDVDLLLVLPEHIPLKMMVTYKPGYVQLALLNFRNLEEKFKGLKKLCVPKTNEISAQKMVSWFEGLSTKYFDRLCLGDNVLRTVSVDDEKYDIRVKLTKSEYGSTMNIVAQDSHERVIKIDVNLVPCIVLPEKWWPGSSSRNYTRYFRQYDSSKHGSSGTFFMVPKSPVFRKGELVINPEIFWQLSFEQQERAYLGRSEVGCLKPALRLLKKLRDHWKHPFSSYIIKNLFLWEVKRREHDNFWNRPLSIVFIEMLEMYAMRVYDVELPYFWHENVNLLLGCIRSDLEVLAHEINDIAQDIKKWSPTDPFVVAKHIVSEEEVAILRQELPMVKVKEERPIQTSSKPTVSSYRFLHSCPEFDY